jgi:DNA polymerase-1
MDKVWASPYATDIVPCALIHDAIYLMVRDDIKIISWVNQELIKSMQWQELPELQHDKVKLGANLDLYWPSWADPITLKNDAPRKAIMEQVKTYRLLIGK